MIEKAPAAARPILIVPYVWIGDFVRCHSVVRLLRGSKIRTGLWISSPRTLCAPLADYMPGVRRAIVADLPRRRLGLALQFKLAADCAREGYGQALVMSRKWKAALAPWLAGIPLRTGFFGEVRFGLLNDLRFGERRLPRMIDQMGALALPKGAAVAGRMAAAGAEGAGGRTGGLAGTPGACGRKPAGRHAVPGRGRRRQSLAAGALRGAGQGAGAGRRFCLGAGRAERDGDRPADRRGRRRARP